MAGLSVTITLLDEELLGLLNDPAKSVRFVE
jgi:dihydroxyacetone kinase